MDTINNTEVSSDMTMDTTFKVATLFHCESIDNYNTLNQNTLWKQTLLGCKIVQLLQEVHGFNITYVYQEQDLNRDMTMEILTYLNGSEVDFYVRPMSLRPDALDLAHPIGASIFDWNFGFTICYPDYSYRNYYSKPFTRRAWNVLYGMAFLCSIFFYLLKRWENKIKKKGKSWECSFGYEVLMVIGAYCQHIPPIEAHLYSLRTAYFVFFIFAYIIYSYYTSNLLSHLVNDKNNIITLEELLDSNIECVVLENVKAFLNNNLLHMPQIHSIYSSGNISSVFEKLLNLRAVSIEEGLRAVKTTYTALLSDYTTIAPYLRGVFTTDEICNLAEIDVVSNIKKYFFVSKTFRYMEAIKNTLLRAKESGILHRLVYYNYKSTVECAPLPHVQTQFSQIMYPLVLLAGVYVLCLIILWIEIECHRRFKVWPYVN